MAHTCVGCGVQIPGEDGHEKCVRCLGESHAALSRNNPSSCMNCFILPRPCLEARYCAFKNQAASLKRQAQSGPHVGAGVNFTPPLIISAAPLYELPETEGQEESEVESEGSSDSDVPPSQEGEAASGGEEKERSSTSLQFKALIERAARALGVESGVGAPAPSRFDSDTAQPYASFAVPLLSDVEGLMKAGFVRPTEPFKPTAGCRGLSIMQNREKVGCAGLPQVDQTIAALVFPSGSVLGKTACPSKSCRGVDALLAKVLRTISIQAQWTNTAAILTLYQRQLLNELDEGHNASLVSELRLVSSVMTQVMKEQAAVAGRSIASLWVTRRQLWLPVIIAVRGSE